MTRQIGGSDDSPPTLSFYVRKLEVRRLLIPETRDGRNGYLCRTITNTTSEPADRVLETQSDFEKVLVDMHLMESNAPSRRLAAGWPGFMDDALRGANRLVGIFTGSRTFETWLPLLH